MNTLIEPTELPELGLTVGFLNMPGAGFRVATAGGGDGHTRHLSIAAARRLADELEAAGGPDLAEAVAVLRAKAERLDEWLKQPRDEAQTAEFEALRESEDA